MTRRSRVRIPPPLPPVRNAKARSRKRPGFLRFGPVFGHWGHAPGAKRRVGFAVAPPATDRAQGDAARPVQHGDKWRIRWFDENGGRQPAGSDSDREAALARAKLSVQVDEVMKALLQLVLRS